MTDPVQMTPRQISHCVSEVRMRVFDKYRKLTYECRRENVVQFETADSTFNRKPGSES